jgi:hypothetical protein
VLKRRTDGGGDLVHVSFSLCLSRISSCSFMSERRGFLRCQKCYFADPYCKLVFLAKLFSFNISRAKVYGLKNISAI